MRRTRWLGGLAMLASGGGAAMLLAERAGTLPQWVHPPAATPAGIALMLVGTAAAILEVASLRAGFARVARAARRRVEAEQLESLPDARGDLAPLTGAINSCLGFAEQSVKDAAASVRQLQIQLKVATGERQQAQAIVYSISDAVLVTDTFDELLLANDAAGKLLGFDAGSVRRKPLREVVADETLVSLIEEMRQSQTSSRRVVEHAVQTTEGERSVKLTLACVADPVGEPSGVVAVLHDTTREREIARMKNDFVSHVSHELRTPLASIKAYVEMLVDGEAHDDKTRQEFYEVIQNESNRLSRLIDNILNISRIESGLVKVNRQPTSLTVLIKQAIEVVSPQASARRITLQEQLDPAFYQTLGDRDMLYQSVMNLLSNAIKYTPEGGTITVRTAPDETTRTVSVRIADTGVGIPPKDLPHVFDKFYRVEANNRMAKGTGLGLSLVKHIVETVHRGKVFVDSEVGKGSTFGFTLDLCD